MAMPFMVGISLLLLFSNRGLTQSQMQFRVITPQDGLSNNFVRSIFQDRKGFMWIGTENGVDRYDGYQMTSFKDDPINQRSLKGNFVLEIFEDRQSNIWVLTDKGLNCLDPVTADFELISIKASVSMDQRHTNFIKEDRKGNLWVSITGGLYHFNAAQRFFGAIQLDREWPAFFETEILSLEEDNQGNLWLGSNTLGLIRFRYNEEQNNWSAKPFHPPGIADPWQVKKLITNDGEYLWLASSTGIYRFDPVEEVFEVFEPSINFGRPNRLLFQENLAFDDQGRLLFTSPLGIHRVEEPKQIPLGKACTSFTHQLGLDRSQFIYGQWITDLAVDQGNWVWAGTEDGLYHINMETGESTAYVHNSFEIGSISANRISELLIDRDQNLWVGTYGGGLNMSIGQQPFQQYIHQQGNPRSLSSNQVRSMVMDDAGYLWVATLQTGLDKMEYVPRKGWVKVKNWRHDPDDPTSLPSNALIDIIKTRSGKLWIALAAGYGLIELDPITGKMEILRQTAEGGFDYSGIWALCEDQEGYIWLGTRKAGVFRLNPADRTLQNFQEDTIWANALEENFIHDVYEDRQGNIWIATFDGLFRHNPDEGSLKTYRHSTADPHSLSNSSIWTLREDPAGTLWIGTGQGLNKFDWDTERFERFFVRDGLPSNVVWGIQVDQEGYLWASTDAGLARSFSSTHKEPIFQPEQPFRAFGRNALNGEAFLPHAYCEDHQNGQLFFGGLNGFNVVYTDQVQLDTTQPRMRLSTFTIYNQMERAKQRIVDPFISNKQEVDLNYLDDVLIFTFSDLNFQAKGQDQFEYQLLGLSSQWIPLEESKTMTFIDLTPGTYSLKVRGTKPDGFPIQAKPLLTFSIYPPWWRSWWAFLIYSLLGLGCFFFFKQYEQDRRRHKQQAEVERARAEEKRLQAETVEVQARQLERSLSELQEKNEEILIAQNQLIQQEKLASLGQLTAGIAHEIKNPLNFINNFAEDSKELLEELTEELDRQRHTIDAERYDELITMITDLQLNAKDIHENGIRVDRIVRSMMDHARGSKSERREIDLNQLLSDNANLAYHGYRALDSNFNVYIEKDLDMKLPLVGGYPQELGRALLNLINNACYAVQLKQKNVAPDYQPTISIKTHATPEEVEIMIRDNGPGIPQAIQKKIFTPFFTTKPSGEGNTGLGLSITYDIIVQQHRGKIELESEVGKFTQFLIRLPLN